MSGLRQLEQKAVPWGDRLGFERGRRVMVTLW
jgi:hypothetical protein